MKKMYSKKVYDLAYQKNNFLIIPDLIMVKDGFSCGDKIVILGQVDNDILRFNFYSENSCVLSRAVCSLLVNKYNEKNIFTIQKDLLCFYKNILNNNEYICNELKLNFKKYFNRFECLISPVSLFIDFIKGIQKEDEEFTSKPYTLNTMDCDACVGACKINWKNKKVVKNDHLNGKKFDTAYLKKWMPYGKMYLNNSEITSLKNDVKFMKEEDYQFLSDYTMNGFVLRNLLTYCSDEISSNWKATSYLIQKNEILLNYFERILKYINDKKFLIYPVKGYVTQKFYDDPSIRIHSDFDLISENDEDAFKLMNYLLNNGFTIRPNLFSIKKMYDLERDDYCVSGHFHLQKIIDDMYNFEIDLTFPGFPVNRVEVFRPNILNNNISIEEQIIITLLHLFKHSNVYIKDINDMFYMLNSNKFKYDYLANLLNKFNLFNFFELTVSYIYRNYNVDSMIFKKIITYFKIDLNCLNIYRDWPYDLNSHLKIKREDYENRIEHTLEHERIYLYPIVIFKDIINISDIIDKLCKAFNVQKISNSIYKLELDSYVFYLTSIGIFIENYVNTSGLSRRVYIQIFEKILKEFNINDLLSIPYAIEHFYVRVI